MSDQASSERLQDRARSGFAQRRQQALEDSTRLRDHVDSQFQQRRQQAQRAREAIAEQRDRFGEALDIDGSMIEPVQLDGRGEQFGFVPDERGEDLLIGRFADERPFVEADEAIVDADPVEGVLTRTDPGATDTIAARAREDAAGQMEFVESDDIDAAVGPGGVESVGIAEDRFDDVADRTAIGLASDDPFAEPGDFDVAVDERGIEDARLSEVGARRRAGRQFTAETPLEQVDPDSDIVADGGRFTLAEPAQRRVAARQFESELDLFDTGTLDPDTDIRDTNGGFGLGERPARQVAAAELDAQFGEFDIGPGDIELQDTGDGFEAVFEREVSR